MVAALSIFTLPAFAAENFSVALPSGAAVTMGDASGTLSFTVTNDAASTKTIKKLFFNINTSLYDISASTQAPASCASAWSVDAPKTACQLPGCIAFSSAGGIAPGASCTFDLVVTGAGDTAIVSAAADQTDTLASIVPSSNQGATQQNPDFTLIGGLPTWQRKALAISISASPASTGVGGQIVVTMTVTNRSSAIQSNITANPSPPTVAGTGGAVVVGGAIYGSSTFTTNPAPAALRNDMDSTQNTVPVFSTAGFPASGRVLVDTELIDYTGITANSFTGATRGVGGTSAAAHLKWANVYSQNTSAFTLAIGESSTIKRIYRATSTGYVNFTARVQNSTGTSTSRYVTSNNVIIGDFTAAVSVAPLSVISGQTVTVTMTVTNNGSTTLTSITPSLTPGGTATATLASGPTPASIVSLVPGAVGQFQWQYTITGTMGQTFNFTGSATATGPITSNSSTSATGSIVVYSVSVSPTLVSGGATNVTITWTVYNNASTPVKSVQIDISPVVDGTCGLNRWDYGSNTPPANWTSATVGTPVTGVLFTSNNPVGTYGILQGQSKQFSMTLNCAPTVMSDTIFNFPVTITDNNNVASTVDSEVTVTAYTITLDVYDVDCTSAPPASKPADGASEYCLIATLSRGGAPAAGEALAFTTTAGALAPVAGITDSNGQVKVVLTAPCMTSDVSATVQAIYNPQTMASRAVDFTAVATPALSYVSGSLTFYRSAPSPTGDITSPGLSIATGDLGYFRLIVRSCGPAALTVHPADTSLAIISGSPDTFLLDSLVDVTIPSMGTTTLTFASGIIASGPLQCYPLLAIDAEYAGPTDYDGPYAFDKASPGDMISDTVTVSGGTECSATYRVRILNWREVF